MKPRKTAIILACCALLSLGACETAPARLVTGPTPLDIKLASREEDPNRITAMERIEASRGNGSAREIVPALPGPTQTQRDMEDGLLALSIVRVVATPFMIPSF